ncbi:hypothetical protein GCM10029964_061350 [Kibdelosporangium lantanae]
MTDFDAGDVVELGYGVRLRAVEVSGQAGDARPSPLEGTPVRDAEPADPTDFLADAGSVAPDELGQAILVSGMRLRVTIPFDELVSPQNQPVEPQRGPVDVPHLEIEVEAPEHQDEGQVILEVDNTGHIRWHYPRDAEVANSLERRPGTQVFDIPVERFELPGQMGFSTARGVLGFGVRKVLHLIRFPIERLAEVAVHHMVRWWEQRHRGYQLTLLGEDPRLLVDTDRLAALADKPLLLLVHGTFSTGDAFRQLYSDQQWLANIRKRYGECSSSTTRVCTSLLRTTPAGCSTSCPPTARSPWTWSPTHAAASSPVRYHCNPASPARRGYVVWYRWGRPTPARCWPARRGCTT